MQASEKTTNCGRRVQVPLKIHHNSEGSCTSWFKWTKFRTLCNSACTASSLGSYPAPRYNMRIQYWCREAGLRSSPSYSHPQLIPYQVRPHLWALTMKGHQEHELPWTGASRLPQRNPWKDSPKDGLCLPPPGPCISLSPSPWQCASIYLPPMEPPLCMVTSDVVITKPHISSGLICLRVPLCFRGFHGSDIPKIPLPSLVTSPFASIPSQFSSSPWPQPRGSLLRNLKTGGFRTRI